MANHRDAILSDVIIIVHTDYHDRFEHVTQELICVGVKINDVNRDVGAIEGTVDQSKVPTVQKLPFVDAVRTTFSYIADYPAGDPRDQDGPEKDD